MNTGQSRKRRSPYRRTAITVPSDILTAIDEAAHGRGESRSSFISRVLHLAVRARNEAEITRRLNALFADEALANEQLQGSRELDRQGTDWTDERW